MAEERDELTADKEERKGERRRGAAITADVTGLTFSIAGPFKNILAACVQNIRQIQVT